MDWPETLPATLHGTSVALGSRGLLLVGPSGSGKSSIALQIMGYGASLVSDDLTELVAMPESVVGLQRPSGAAKQSGIEARGMGLLAATPAERPVRLTLVADLTRTEPARLPNPQIVHLGGAAIPCIHKVDNSAFPAMLLQYLRAGFLPSFT